MSDDAAENPDEKDKKAKKAKKDKKAKTAAAPESGPKTVALRDHARATSAIARLRSMAALGAMAFVALLSYRAGASADDCILRGLVAGIVGYFVGWYVGVTLWRQLVRQEIRIAFAERAAAVTAEKSEAAS
jgi:hypothetical protein